MLKLLYIGIIMAAFGVSGCQPKASKDFFVLSGNVTGLPAKKIYLANTANLKVPIDSSAYINGRFSFRIKRELDNSDPFLATLYYLDSVGNRNFIMVQNNFKAPNGKGSFRGFFMLEESPFAINGSYANYSKVTGGIQNKVLDHRNILDFGLLPKSREQRQVSLKRYKSFIRDNNNSYLLLILLNRAQTSYSKEELESLLAGFDQEVQNSRTAKDLKSTLSLRIKAGDKMPSFLFENASGRNEEIAYANHKVNMLVFWASWCGPCRDEIPQLKKIQGRFKDRGLAIWGISIDSNKESWLKALKEKSTTWKQLIAQQSDIKRIKGAFNFNSIPFTVIINGDGVETFRTMGYDKNLPIEAIIEKELKK